MKTSTVRNFSYRMNEKMCALLLKRYYFSREKKTLRRNTKLS